MQVSCDPFTLGMKKLSVFRVSQLVNDCDRVKPSITDSAPVSCTATHVTLLPEDLTHLAHRGDTTLEMQPRRHLLGMPLPPPAPRPPPVSCSRAEAVPYLSKLVFMEVYIQSSTRIVRHSSEPVP